MPASRREFLGAGVVVAGGVLLAPRLGPAAASAASTSDDVALVSVARYDGGHAGVTRSGAEAQPSLRRVTVEPGMPVRVGDQLAELPPDVMPTTVVPAGDGLLVGGAREIEVGEVPTLPEDELVGASTAEMLDGSPDSAEASADEILVPVYSHEACLFRVTGASVEEITLSALSADVRRARFSVVEALLTVENGTWALVAHSGTEDEAAYGAYLSLLHLPGDGSISRRGNGAQVAANLGESGPNFLAAPGGQTQVLINQMNGGGGFHTRLTAGRGDGGLRTVATPAAGRAVAFFDGGSVVEDQATGQIWWEPTEGGPPPAVLDQLDAEPGQAPQILPIAGEPGGAVAVIGNELTAVDLS